VFNGGGSESPESGENTTTFSGLTGTPAATVETPESGGDYLLADVGLPAANSPMNQYSVTSSVSKFHNFGWQLFMPEQ
jgi:hypothetical protein